MENCVKERVYQSLKKRNYFEFGKTDSLEVFEKAEHLEDVIIQVERNCNVDNLLFRYNPTTCKFHRVTLTNKDIELLNREVKYDVHRKCIERQCIKNAINVDSFIELLEFAFEPIGIFNASETNI